MNREQLLENADWVRGKVEEELRAYQSNKRYADDNQCLLYSYKELASAYPKG